MAAVTEGTAAKGALPVRPPPRRDDPWTWARRELFSGPVNALVSVVFGAALAYAAYRILAFTFVNTEWEVVRRNLRLFMVGRFPVDELWRVWVAGYLVVTAVGIAAGVAGAVAVEAAVAKGRPPSRPPTTVAVGRFAPLLVLVVVLVGLTRTVVPGLLAAGAVATLLVVRTAAHRVPAGRARALAWLLALAALVGAFLVLTGFGGVGWDAWGGLLLTLFATVAGIVLSFPLGIVLAFGRRSHLPAVRWLSGAYIELFRGVPLVTLLIISQVSLGFFFPTSIDPPSLLARGLIAIVLFESAYMAEVVRGGLQSVPGGQIEAAQALGLRRRQVVRRVVLPQALRAVIPATVGQFISLFKDTSLLGVVAFFELLRVSQTVLSQPDFRAQGLDAVTLGFAGFIYWVVSYTMSKESRRLERRLGADRA